jgi:hypothetical protein
VPTSVTPRRDDATFYQLYFQTPGLAEAELERDVRQTFVKMLGNVPRGGRDGATSSVGMVPRAGGFLAGRPTPAALPAWLNEADIDFYVSEFKRSRRFKLVPQH